MQRVADGRSHVGKPGDGAARVDHARAHGQVLAEQFLAGEHDSRGGIGVDGDDALVGGATRTWTDCAHLFLSPPLGPDWARRALCPFWPMWPAGRYGKLRVE